MGRGVDTASYERDAAHARLARRRRGAHAERVRERQGLRRAVDGVERVDERLQLVALGLRLLERLDALGQRLGLGRLLRDLLRDPI